MNLTTWLVLVPGGKVKVREEVREKSTESEKDSTRIAGKRIKGGYNIFNEVFFYYKKDSRSLTFSTTFLQSVIFVQNRAGVKNNKLTCI